MPSTAALVWLCQPLKTWGQLRVIYASTANPDNASINSRVPFQLRLSLTPFSESCSSTAGRESFVRLLAHKHAYTQKGRPSLCSQHKDCLSLTVPPGGRKAAAARHRGPSEGRDRAAPAAAHCSRLRHPVQRVGGVANAGRRPSVVEPGEATGSLGNRAGKLSRPGQECKAGPTEHTEGYASTCFAS